MTETLTQHEPKRSRSTKDASKLRGGSALEPGEHPPPQRGAPPTPQPWPASPPSGQHRRAPSTIHRGGLSGWDVGVLSGERLSLHLQWPFLCGGMARLTHERVEGWRDGGVDVQTCAEGWLGDWMGEWVGVSGV